MRKSIAKKGTKVKRNGKTGTVNERSVTIRLQLMLGFAVPVFFVVLVGIMSYQSASQGLVTNYESSSVNALEMTVGCLEEALRPVMTTAAELAQDATVTSYGLGGFSNDSAKESQAITAIRNNLSVKQTASDMISNIYIIPVGGSRVITTANTQTGEVASFIGQIPESEDAVIMEDNHVRWGTSHSFIDEKMGLTGDDYTMYCSKTFSSGGSTGVVIIDISTSAVNSILQQLDFGDQGQVTFITSDGTEIGNSIAHPVVGTDFFTEGVASGEEIYSRYLNCEGTNYFYMMCRSATSGGYVTVMVPKTVITQSSDSIRSMTIILVSIALVIAVFISIWITGKISKNIQKSVKKLDRVANGELREESVKGPIKNDEFGRLHKSISGTIVKIRALVITVKEMIEAVSTSGERVNESSRTVGELVDDMSIQIEEITHNIEREDTEISVCSDQMETLSKKIKLVNESISQTVTHVTDTKQMIHTGIEAVDGMTRQSKETTEVTTEVLEHVAALAEKLEDIVTFVQQISAIAEATNLLSLNASIEAARAGENGKGFSVVAEEIRKLADNSADTARNIQTVIGEIKDYTEVTIEKVQAADGIVIEQEKSVENTAEVLSRMNEFMESFVVSLENVESDVEAMNTERRQALTSIRTINDISQNTVVSANSVSAALSHQIESANTLTGEAEGLQRHMQQLEEAVASFILE